MSEPQHYFYQFHVDIADQLDPIIQFLKKTHHDPSSCFCVGIAENHTLLTESKEVDRINSIINCCYNNSYLIPIIHFSFLNSPDIFEDERQIKQLHPRIINLQINDLSSLRIATLQKFSELFSLSIPLSNENFNIVYNLQFRNLVRENKSFILLDNSKGKGIKEDTKSFLEKINILHYFRLYNIVLCGGFGPDQLDSYFEVRNHYKMKFSIDAETNLRSNHKFDVEKIKRYLTQLINFDKNQSN